MHVIVSTRELRRELALSRKLIEKSAVDTPFENVELRTAPGAIEIRTADRVLLFRARCDARVLIEGRCIVRATRLSEMFRLLDDGDVTLRSDGGGLEVKTEKSNFTLPSAVADAFPSVPKVSAPLPYRWPRAGFKQMLSEALIIVSRDERTDSGAWLKTDGDMAMLTATDRVRLSYSRLPVTRAASFQEDKPLRVFISRRALIAASMFAESGAPTIDVGLAEDHLVLQTARRRLTLWTSAIPFRDYARIIQRRNPHRVSCGRNDLSRALQRVLVVSDERTRAVSMSIARDSIVIASVSAAQGSALEFVSAAADIEMTLVVNGSFLLDFLSVTRDSDVVLEFRDAKDQCIAFPARNDVSRTQFIYAFMPMFAE